MTDSFGYTSPQEADSTVIPSLSRDLKALVMREIPRQARNDSKDFYRITLTQPKESVIEMRSVRGKRLDCIVAGLLVLGAAALRITYLNSSFHSSDHAELAVRIIRNPGYSWMLRELYGFLISFYVKICVGMVSAFGIHITEFWWRLPVAAVASLQPALTYFFLQWLGCRRLGALAGALFIGVLPIHVCISRYMWGYETLGTFCITLALWALIAFLMRPGRKLAVLASSALALYLISHGYILPFAVSFFCILLLYGGSREQIALKRFAMGIRQLVCRLIWLGPLIVSPLLVSPIRHALNKKTELGLYISNHFPTFVACMGWILCALVLAAVASGFFLKTVRTRATVLFTISGAAYFAPLIFGTPPGLTVVEGYLIMGCYFWILAAAIVLDRFAERCRLAVVLLVVFCTVLTAWGAKSIAIFPDKGGIKALYVRPLPGTTPRDCGSKAAGYYVRKYVPETCRVLALARVIEPPNLFYYFERDDYAFYDLSPKATIQKYKEMCDEVDVIICSKRQRSVVENNGHFVLRATISNRRHVCIWIYSKKTVVLPKKNMNTWQVNPLFDLEFAPRVSFLR